VSFDKRATPSADRRHRPNTALEAVGQHDNHRRYRSDAWSSGLAGGLTNWGSLCNNYSLTYKAIGQSVQPIDFEDVMPRSFFRGFFIAHLK
jgi:hypothetical protein